MDKLHLVQCQKCAQLDDAMVEAKDDGDWKG